MRKYSPNISCLFLGLCIFNFFVSEDISAQGYNIQTFTTKDGLSHNDVRAIALDSTGFLWIATWDGLSRYDGYTFKNYFHDPDDSLSLPYFSIYNIIVDGGNNLWLTTDIRTVAKYDPYNDIFALVDQLYDSLPENFIGTAVDESGYFWLGGSDKLFRYDFTTNKFDKFELCDSLGKTIYFPYLYDFTISTSDVNKVWLVGVRVFEFERSIGNKLILKNQYEVERNNHFEGYDFSFNFCFRIFHSGSGKKWIFSNVGLYLLDEKRQTFREFNDPLPVNDFKGSGYLYWCRYKSGLYIYSLKEARLSHIPYELCQLSRAVFCQDRDLIWFTSSSITGSGFGLNRIIFTPDYFRNYPIVAEKNDIPAVYAITRDSQERIWVGLRGNVPLIQITPDLKVRKLEFPDYRTTSEYGAVRSLTPSPDGVWIGYFRDLLLFYDLHTNEITRYFPEAWGFRPVAIDKKGDLYLSGENRNTLVRFSPSLQITEKLIENPIASPVYKILIDKKEIVWGGLNRSQIIRFDPASGKADSFILSKGNYNVEDICEGDNGTMWFALLGGGVCNFDPETGKKTFFTTSDGLTNNMTYCILKDNSGNIWVSTNTGISRINPKTGLIRTFGQNEGLNIIEFNSGASYAADDGEFLLGGMGGLVGFYPDLINREEIQSGNQRAFINEIRVSGKPKNYRRTVSKADTVILEKGENNFMVYFSSTDFVHSEKTLYRYKLSEINRDWVESDSRNRNISYGNLHPGWYNFQLQATDRSGSWSYSKELRIRIKPYYYQTPFFRITAPVTALLLILSLIIIYIRQIKQREAQKQAALRLQSLRGQMNPHFIFNSLNSINYFISNNDKLSANRYIADFSKLIRSILHNLSNDSITLDKEIESIEDYLKIEYLRFGDKFDYEIKVEKEIDYNNLNVSPGIIQPFIENAIWHGVRGLENRKGKIEVLIGFKDKKLTCIVKDDGIGRKRSEMLNTGSDQKKSRGISIVLERLKIINGLQGSHYQIVISDLYPGRQESGTLVEIDLPVTSELLL